MKNRIRVLPFIIFAAMCIGAFVAPFLFPSAEAARNGYVEKRDDGTAFANQLAPDPVTGMCLQADASNRTVWGPCGNLPPDGTPGQVLGVKALTATRTVVVTGTATSVGTETYSYTVSQTSTGTGTITQTGTATNTVKQTGTYTYTATSTSTGISSSGTVDTGTRPRGLCMLGNTAYVASGGYDWVNSYDISNPASPTAYDPIPVGDDPRGIACSDGWVFAANYNGYSISVIDAATPGSEHVESTYLVPTDCYPRDLAVWGNRLYVICAGSGTFLTIDITNKVSLSQIGSALSIGARPNDITVDDSTHARIAFLDGKKVATIDLHGGGTDVPTIAGYVDNTYQLNSIAQKPGELLAATAITGNRLYLYDTSNDPVLVGSVATSASPSGVAFYGSVVIVAGFSDDKIQVYSVALSGNPVFVDEFSMTTGCNPVDLKMSGDYVWATCYTGAKLRSFYVGKYKNFTGTNTQTGTATATNTQTGTATLTKTTTSASTGTRTVAGTGFYTASATGIGTGTGTEVKWQGANVYDQAGTFFLSSINGEGEDVPIWMRWGELQAMTPHSYSATCSTGSDGLIATIEPLAPQLVTRTRAPSGWWKAHLKARVNANGAAIRVETWTHDPPSSDMKLFDWTTDVFTSVAPSIVSKEFLRTPEDTTSSGGPLKIFFKLYATCSTSTTVYLDLGDSDFDSRIQSPFLGDRILASEVQQVGYPGYTVQDVLTDFGNSRRTIRKIMIPAAQFEILSVPPFANLGTAPNILRVVTLYDGETDYASAALVTIPTDLATTSISVVPVWAPVVTDMWSFAKIRWSLTHKVLQRYPTHVDVTAAGTTTVWSGNYCYDYCIANYVQEYDGYTITGINAGDTVMFSIARVGADAADTFIGDINLIGVRIEYLSSL